MRLWTLHPCHLDAQGLVAVWREGLLAQAVLRGRTRGYKAHPQLMRFRAAAAPLAAIGTYLAAVHAEAERRGYRFDASRITRCRTAHQLPATTGQMVHEWNHLKRKLKARAPSAYHSLLASGSPRPHPLFRVVRGARASWERPTRIGAAGNARPSFRKR